MSETSPDLPLSRSTVDRGGYLRQDPAAVDAAWAGAHTRVVRVDDGRTWVDATGEALVLVTTDDSPDGERYYLGHDNGTQYFAVRAPLGDPPAGAQVAGLREIGGGLGPRDTGLAVHAIALERWHASHQHCPRCGARTVVTHGGAERDCPVDGSSHFPRVDPAVIMLVYDNHDRCVLGHQMAWPKGRFSVLAGFVEPGESLERAVAREVVEEVNLEVGDIRYFGSQPWPFPSSLMLGFTARVTGGELKADEQEIAEARWFSRTELAEAVAGGEVLPPTPFSIAYRLIENWYGGPLPTS
ncbi:MAG: NAD(+) diphosphatase [Streptosporangiales bacterium]|nr:NAD(+) diphosphatase [Streptosporangiales bacterium]MBO0889657.1 NAD(+) diphosphatase [Acidothermales bacterium]